jgi:hypothetical protein
MNKYDVKILKISLLALGSILSSYPPLELTRLIWTAGIYYYPNLDSGFVVETSIIWLFWVATPISIWLLLNHIFRNFDKTVVSSKNQNNTGKIGLQR